jgi:hypothetical protein
MVKETKTVIIGFWQACLGCFLGFKSKYDCPAICSKVKRWHTDSTDSTDFAQIKMARLDYQSILAIYTESNSIVSAVWTQLETFGKTGDNALIALLKNRYHILAVIA